MKRRHAGPPMQVGGYNFRPQFANDRDAMIRTMLAEAGGEKTDAAKLAVGHVLQNRADANYNGYGGSIADQALAKNQFSSFNRNMPKVNIAGRNAMRVDPNSEQYRHMGELADQVMGRIAPDPTHGADSYFALQGMKGHKPPRWYEPNNVTAKIEHHEFQRSHNFDGRHPEGQMRPGDQQMLASMGGGKTLDAGTSPMATMLAQAVSPAAKPTQTAMANPPLPPEANSAQRYRAMNAVAPRPDNNTSFRDMARHTAYAPNRGAAMQLALHEPRPESSALMASMSKDPMSPAGASDPGMPSSGEFLASRYGNDLPAHQDSALNHLNPADPSGPLLDGGGGPLPAAQPGMADTPVLHEPLSAGVPGGEGMAANSMSGLSQMAMPQGGGIADMMAMAVAPPMAMGGDPGFNMGGGIGGGFDFGGFNLGGLFG